MLTKINIHVRKYSFKKQVVSLSSDFFEAVGTEARHTRKCLSLTPPRPSRVWGLQTVTCPACLHKPRDPSARTSSEVPLGSVQLPDCGIVKAVLWVLFHENNDLRDSGCWEIWQGCRSVGRSQIAVKKNNQNAQENGHDFGMIKDVFIKFFS